VIRQRNGVMTRQYYEVFSTVNRLTVFDRARAAVIPRRRLHDFEVRAKAQDWKHTFAKAHRAVFFRCRLPMQREMPLL